jgi:GTP-binding protein LepA
MNYEVFEYRPADVVRMDILVADEIVEAFATFVYRDEAERVGRKIVASLKTTIPQQQFVIKLQAAIGGKVVASERISAMRKDVTAGLYGGDVSRKKKLLEKQKKGKKRMMEMGVGKVSIPSEAYMSVLKR